jgi:hypothetical protein
MERLTNLKRYLNDLLPNSRERHAMLEMVGILQEFVDKQQAPEEENVPKKTRKSVKSTQSTEE